jgi:sirohydrochlorin cobaltochelatase
MSATAWPRPVTEAATLLLCAHGARGVAGAAARHAKAIGQRGLFRQVEACALYGEPRLEAVAAGLAGPLAVLPFMMAEGYTLEKLAGRLAACRPDARLLPALGGNAAMAELLVARALKGLGAHGRPPAETALLLVGHGTTRHEASAETAWRHARAIREQDLFAEVAVAFLDEPPLVRDAVAGLRAPFIAAVGFLTDAGTHGAGDVARLLAETGRAGVYFGPIGPDPAVVPLIIEQLRRQ